MKKNHWLDHLVDVMCSLHDSTEIAIDDFGLDPIPGSIASIELDTSDDSKLLLTAYSQGSLMIQVVMDHYNSLARAITQPVLTISPWTTMRSLMEASAIGIWLLSVNIDINERISRSLKFRCEGLLQQKKFGRVLGTNTEVKAITHHHQEVLLKAKDHGLYLQFDENGNPKDLRNRMPSVTNLISEQLDKEGAFRLFSSIAHAHPWALQNLSFKLANVPDKLLLEKDINLIHLKYIGDLVFIITKLPIIEKCKLFGWPYKGIDQMSIKAYEKFSGTVSEIINKTT